MLVVMGMPTGNKTKGEVCGGIRLRCRVIEKYTIDISHNPDRKHRGPPCRGPAATLWSSVVFKAGYLSAGDKYTSR